MMDMQGLHPPVASRALIHLQKSDVDLNLIKSVLGSIHQQPPLDAENMSP
jgi:hypothetical protein